MTYLSRLQSLRTAATAAVEASNAAKGGAAAKKAGTVGLAPLAPGAAKPAPKMAQGLSSAMLRQTIGDLITQGQAVGLPATFVTRHARALEGEGPTLDALAGSIAKRAGRAAEPVRSTIAGLFARVAASMSEELTRLDVKDQAAILRGLATGLAAAFDRGLAPSPVLARSIEALASAIAATGSRDVAGLVLSAIGHADAAGERAPALGRVFADVMDRLLGAAPDHAKAAFVGLALDVAAAAVKSDDAPKDLVARIAGDRAAALTPGQTKILGELARDTSREVKADAKAVKGAEREAARLSKELGAFEGKLARVAPLAARAEAELDPIARAAWLAKVDASRAKPEVQLFATSLVTFEALSRKSPDPLPEAGLRALDRAATALARAPGITEDVLTAIVGGALKTEALESWPGIFTGLSEVAAELEASAPGLARPELFPSLAHGLSGRTETFAKAEGATQLAVAALAQAKTDAQRASMGTWLPRFVEATKKAEAGPARDALEAHLAADAAALAAAGVDPAALAATYPKVPEDALLRLAAIGLANRRDLDKWLGTLTSLFSETKGSKERVRTLRTLLVLAEEAPAEPKAKSIAIPLAEALGKAKMRPQELTRTANALLDAEQRQLTRPALERAIDMLGRGEDVAGEIETAMRRAMMRELDLDGLLKGAKVKLTDEGVEAVTGPLAGFFTQAVNDGELDRTLVKRVLVAALEDRIHAFRFETKPAARQLKVLTAEQRALWEKPAAMNHVRLSKAARGELDDRVNAAAAFGRALGARMEAAWGDLDALRETHGALVDELRNLPKKSVEKRRALIGQLSGLPARIHAMEWARELAALTPATTTPLRFAKLAEELPAMGRLLGPGMRPAVEELLWTIRIDDLQYSEVTTHDGPDLATMTRLASTNCLGGNLTAILAYCLDPNKKMIVTKNQAGEERRAVVRLVERQDAGHVGEPMLVLERTYPDSASEEEKQRLVEHVLRRAAEMGIAAGYPTEYYWDVKATNRFAHNAAVQDTKKVLEDLERRYEATAERLTMKVVNRAGNMPREYIDSAPVGGAADAGNMQQRQYHSDQDLQYENVFVVLEPR
ncbi:hypothetical protein L6R52_08950 [Myxococcota bacterium]|nr:hypothetical protein [Myxococcota bacterium]